MILVDEGGAKESSGYATMAQMVDEIFPFVDTGRNSADEVRNHRSSLDFLWCPGPAPGPLRELAHLGLLVLVHLLAGR